MLVWAERNLHDTTTLNERNLSGWLTRYPPEICPAELDLLLVVKGAVNDPIGIEPEKMNALE